LDRQAAEELMKGVVDKLIYENLDVSFQLVRQIDHNKEVQKLTISSICPSSEQSTNALPKG